MQTEYRNALVVLTVVPNPGKEECIFENLPCVAKGGMELRRFKNRQERRSPILQAAPVGSSTIGVDVWTLRFVRTAVLRAGELVINGLCGEKRGSIGARAPRIDTLRLTVATLGIATPCDGCYQIDFSCTGAIPDAYARAADDSRRRKRE